MTTVHRERFYLFKSVGSKISHYPGFKAVAYADIRIASISEAGVEKLRKHVDQLGINMSIVADIADAGTKSDLERDVLRTFYRQYRQMREEVKGVINEIRGHLYTKQYSDMFKTKTYEPIEGEQ